MASTAAPSGCLASSPSSAPNGSLVGAHEQPSDDLHDQHLAAVRQPQQGAAAPGRAGQHVERPDQARVLVDVADQLALVEDMIAGGDQIGAGGVEILADLGGDAEAAGGVLAVDDHDVQAEIGAQPRQPVDQHPPSGPADDVAAETRDPHGPAAAGPAEAVQRGLRDHAVERDVGRAGRHLARPPARRTRCRSRAGAALAIAGGRACGRSSPCHSPGGRPVDRTPGAAPGPRRARARGRDGSGSSSLKVPWTRTSP